jgi:hypothetical protein
VGEFIVACRDAPEVLQSVEGALDPPAQLVEAPIEAEGLFPAGAVGNNRLGSTSL